MSIIKCSLLSSSKSKSTSISDVAYKSESDALLICDSNTYISEHIIQKTSKKVFKTFSAVKKDDIDLDKVMNLITLEINRQSEDQCEIKGFTIFIRYSLENKNEVLLINSGNSIFINNKKVSDEITILKYSENKEIFIQTSEVYACVSIEKGSMIKKLNDYIYGIYSNNKLNTIATTTVLSLGSITYMTHQAMHIKQLSDKQISLSGVLTSEVNSLHEQNDIMYRHFENELDVADNTADSNNSAVFSSLEDNAENSENNVSVNEILLQDIQKFQESNAHLKDKIRSMSSSISGFDQILRVHGFNSYILDNNSQDKFKSWIEDKTRNSSPSDPNQNESQIQYIEELQIENQKLKELIQEFEAGKTTDQSVSYSDDKSNSSEEEIRQLISKSIILKSAIEKLQSQLTKVCEFCLKQEYDNAGAISEESFNINAETSNLSSSV
ncbi:MAG: hypothetical protein KAH32_06535 [Chlamydiia bacterium]|nr:hypothetical protein [Chlamydiia bacterium]